MNIKRQKTHNEILRVFHRLDINLRKKIITDFKDLILKFKKHDQKPTSCVCLRCEFSNVEKDGYNLAFNGNEVMEADFCDFLHTNFKLFKNVVLSLSNEKPTVSNVKGTLFASNPTVYPHIPPQPTRLARFG